MSNIKQIKVKSVYDLKKLKTEITENWMKLQDAPGVFRYKLNVQKQKILPGDYKFVVEVSIAPYFDTIGMHLYSSLFLVKFRTNSIT